MSRGSGTVVRGTVEYRNTAEPCEDMPRKSLDIRFTDYPVPQKRGLLRPFPAFRRGRVRAEPANGSRDESLVGFGATPQGLKTINICNFQGSLEPVFSAQFFHRLLDTTLFLLKNSDKIPSFIHSVIARSTALSIDSSSAYFRTLSVYSE